MSKSRGVIILVLGFAACGILAGLASWYLLVVQLPDPSTASRAGLARWLVLRDVAAEPPQVQLALVDRLQAELRSGWETPERTTGLSEAYRRRLRNNAEHLQHVWFEVRVAQFALLSPAEQKPFLIEQIEAISCWSAMEGVGGDPPSAGSAASDDTAVRFFGQIESWIEKASGSQREQMIHAVQDGVVCWLATRDLAEQPRSVRLGLAVQIERELNAGMKLDEILVELTPQERERLLANGELLLEAWLHDQAGEFSAIVEGDRQAFVERRIDDVIKWGVLEALADPPDQAGPPSNSISGATPSSINLRAAGMARLAALVPKWLERATPEDREKLEQLVSHVQTQLLWRQLRGK